MATKRTLTEQIKRRLASGDPTKASSVHPLELDQAILQQINLMLRPQFFEAMQVGDNEVEGSVLCTYTGVTVTAWKDVSKCTLPAIPVRLPRNMGVFRVYAADDVTTAAFIPCSNAEMEMLASQTLLSDILGQTGYKVHGKELIFSRDLTALSPSITSVSLDLVVMDYTRFSEYELLPINAEMEAIVIQNVVQQFLGAEPQPALIDPTPESKK